MMTVVLYIAFLLCTEAVHLPPYISKSCVSDIVSTANNAIPLVLSGDPHYNLQQYLPYRETQRALLNTNVGYFVLNNDRLYGLDTINILDIELNFDSGMYVGLYNFHRLKLKFSYFINIYNTSLMGYGPGEIIIDNINVSQTFNFAADSSNHLFILDATCTYNADNIDVVLKSLESEAGDYLNENYEYFMELLRPQIQRTLSAILTSPIAAIFELVKLDDIFDLSC